MESLRTLFTMVRSDLRQKITDGSVLAFAVIVPLALMWVMNLVFAGATTVELKPMTLAVSAPAGDRMAAVIPQVLGSAAPALNLTVVDATADEAVALVDDGTAGMGIVVPENFSDAMLAGDGSTIDVTLGDDTGVTGQVVSSILDTTLAQLTAGARAQRAGQDLALPPEQLAAMASSVVEEAPQLQWREGHTATEQLGAEESVVAGQAGMFLLFTVGFGVLALVTERDQGTLARLLSMPMRPSLIIMAKGLVSFLLGLLSTTVLLTAGGLLFDNVDFGAPVSIAVLIVLVVAAATSIMFIIAKVARTSEQANVAQSIVAVVLGMSGGAFFPVATTGLVGSLLALNPVKSFTNGLGITAGGGGVGDLGQVALTMGAFTVICLGIAWVLPNRTEAS